jgi:hypothetical protein
MHRRSWAALACVPLLVWGDEFNIDGLPDASRWDDDTDRNAIGWFNHERRDYARALEIDHVRLYLAPR